MTKVLKGIQKVLGWILLIMIVIAVAAIAYNKIMLAKETALAEKSYPGQPVEVDGHSMNVYVSGEGEHTIVFLSGAGGTCPALSFESLYDRLDDTYKTVVVEKFGYGRSDIVDTPRDYALMVDECRQALSKAGVSAPYILCPHSKSGLDALIWAQSYPDEVEAIVGLDMAFPASYKDMDLSAYGGDNAVIDVVKATGIIRMFLPDSSFPDTYTQDEKAMMRALTARGFSNKVFTNETSTIPAAVELIESREKPSCPILLFLTEGGGTGIEKAEWQGYAHSYIDDMDNVTVSEISCGHSEIAQQEADRVCRETAEFIDGLGR
ncbi:MAG: alpha/beta hydrolase [Oscillospiraceae bacterium]|nr:alpha/beta hydrolase [Oscillospiraceae bacterium]